jgi:DNA-binding beta-propeller fold protein YncE
VNNEIFVINRNSATITVYEKSDNGDIAPARTITGVNTGLWAPSGIAVDTVNNEIFVTNWTGYITVFGRIDSGNISL